MNFCVSDIYFSKHEISIYEDLYSRLAEPATGPLQGRIANDVVLQVLNELHLSQESQSLIVAYMKSCCHFERKDFYIFVRLAAILHSQHEISKELVCKFDTSLAFLELMCSTVRKICTDRDNMSSIVLPPPPQTVAGKTKLKRVHTISGPNTAASAGAANLCASINPASSSVNAIFTSPPLINSVAGFSALDALLSARTYSQSPLFSDNMPQDEEMFDFWRITTEQKDYYRRQFSSLQSDVLGTVKGNMAKVFFEKSGLPVAELSRIWKLSDCDRDGALSLPEFCIAMHLVVLRRNNVDIPADLPASMLEIYSALAVDGLRYSPPFGSMGAFSKYHNCMDELVDKMKHSSVTNADSGTTSSSVCSTKNWTQFDDLPAAQRSKSHSRSSPDQPPVNFDYNQESITTNPMIKHPVPLRFSPASAAVAAANMSPLSSITNVSTNPFPNSDSGEWPASPNQANNADPLSPTSVSFWSNGNSSDQKSYLIPSDGALLDSTILTGLEERIISRYKPPAEVTIPKTLASTEELQKLISSLQMYARTVTRQNRLLLDETLSLVKYVRKAHDKHYSTVTNNTNNNSRPF